jgi:hypothetical protein
MVNQCSFPTPRRAHSVPVGPNLRRHRAEVSSWALSTGHLLNRDALAAIVAARAGTPSGPVRLRWSTTEVRDLLVSEIDDWCTRHAVATPRDLSTTLSTYLRYFGAHRLYADGSDGPGELRRAVAEVRGLEPARSRHPASGRRAPVLPIS